MEEKLKELLEGIPDTYDDFSIGLCECCRNDEERQQLIDYIKETPGVNTSNVLEYYYKEVVLKRK